MTKPSLQERLATYFKKQPHTEIAKERIAELAKAKMGVTGETVGRRLRVFAEVSLWGVRPNDTPEHHTAHQLLEGGKLMVAQKNGHAHYTYIPPETKLQRRIEVVDGVAKEIYEHVKI